MARPSVLLARRIASSARPLNISLSAAARPFSSSTRASKTAALADVDSHEADNFDTKQKAFRAKLKEEQQKANRQFSASPAQDPANGKGDAVAEAVATVDKALNLHTSSSTEAMTSGESKSQSATSRGPLSNLLYGTKAGQEMEREIEQSFSQVIARGKYVHSIVFHEVKPDKVDEYVKLVGDWYPKVAGTPANKVHLVGSWRTEVGDCDTFVHIWEYQRYKGYHDSLHTIQSLPDFPEFDRKLKTLINSKKTSLMQEFSFWPTTPPRQLGGIFELRAYTLKPGNLLEWETHWRKGLEARREVMEGVGAWFVQVGALQQVFHMWQFADLEERRIRREKSWGIPGWSDTTHKTIPLIQSMESSILVPMPWSPVA